MVTTRSNTKNYIKKRNNVKKLKTDNTLECPICYESIKHKNYIVTKCNHIFCSDCLFKSLNKKSTCPICRDEIFEFNKIKHFTQDDYMQLQVLELTNSSTFVNGIVTDIIMALHMSLNNSVCTCFSAYISKMIEYISNCKGFNKRFHYLLVKIIKEAISFSSYKNYQNMNEWFINNN